MEGKWLFRGNGSCRNPWTLFRRWVLIQQSSVSTRFIWAWVGFVGFSVWAVSLSSVKLLTCCKLHTFLACSAGCALARRIKQSLPKTSLVKGPEMKMNPFLHCLGDWFCFFASHLSSCPQQTVCWRYAYQLCIRYPSVRYSTHTRPLAYSDTAERMNRDGRDHQRDTHLTVCPESQMPQFPCI